MSEPNGAQDAITLVLRVSVPAHGGYRKIVEQLAARVAAYAGHPEPEAGTAMALLEGVAGDATPSAGGAAQDVTVEFHRVGSELVIEASCHGRSANARQAVPSRPAP